MEELGAVIIAAGLSSRMGKFKPLLPVNKTSFIKCIIDTIRQSCIETIVVVTGYHSAELEEHLLQSTVILVHNERYASTQMLDSVQIGLHKLQDKCSKILITPADVPLVSLETYRKVLAQEADFVRPVFDGQTGHPVVLKQAIIPYVLEFKGTGGLRGAVESSSCSICDLLVDDPAVIMDTDTPEDYSRLLKYSYEQNKMEPDIHLDMQVWLSSDEILCGEGLFRFLELVQLTGSMQRACIGMRMSYSKAWKMLNYAENHMGIALINRIAGGVDGGSSELTSQGSELLWRYTSMKKELDEQAACIFKKHFKDFHLLNKEYPFTVLDEIGGFGLCGNYMIV
jgi:molybdate transport repressor ModE-like protein